MRLGGRARPSAPSAARTRSRDSATALSGKPTMVNAGKPRRDSHLHVDADGLDPLECDRIHPRDHARRPHFAP